MIFCRDRGRDCGHDFGRRGCEFVQGERGSYEGRRVSLRKVTDNVGIVDVAITSLKMLGDI